MTKIVMISGLIAFFATSCGQPNTTSESTPKGDWGDYKFAYSLYSDVSRVLVLDRGIVKSSEIGFKLPVSGTPHYASFVVTGSVNAYPAFLGNVSDSQVDSEQKSPFNVTEWAANTLEEPDLAEYGLSKVNYLYGWTILLNQNVYLVSFGASPKIMLIGTTTPAGFPTPSSYSTDVGTFEVSGHFNVANGVRSVFAFRQTVRRDPIFGLAGWTDGLHFAFSAFYRAH